MLKLRPVTQQIDQIPIASPPLRNYSPKFLEAMNNPVIREQNRLKATDNAKAETKSLTWKQKRFVAEYLADPGRNASSAARRAGYGSYYDPSSLFRHPQIKKLLDEENRKVFQKLEITKEKVLQEVATLAFSNLDNFLVENPEKPGEFSVDLNKCTIQQMAALRDYSVDNGKVRVSLHDKLTSLSLLGKYLKVFEDNSTVNHTFSVEFVDRLVRGEASFADLDSRIIEVKGEGVVNA